MRPAWCPLMSTLLTGQGFSGHAEDINHNHHNIVKRLWSHRARTDISHSDAAVASSRRRLPHLLWNDSDSTDDYMERGHGRAVSDAVRCNCASGQRLHDKLHFAGHIAGNGLSRLSPKPQNPIVLIR